MISTELVELWKWVFGTGALLAAVGLFVALSPVSATSPLSRFPRAVWLGRILGALALLWAGWMLHVKPLEFLIPIQKWIWPIMVACIPLTWFSMPDLLSCRALGGLLCLLPAPVLQLARFHDSPWRLVVVVLMYMFAVVGMVLLMNPYHLRNAISWLSAKAPRQRTAGAVVAAIGVVLIALVVADFARG